MKSRVATTRTLAQAIADSDNRPAFLAGNGIGIYGDHGAERVTEETRSTGDALLARVSRAWQAATEPARNAGARVCILRTSPVYDRRSQPLGALRLQFKAGLGGPLGDGKQYVPLISTRDWVDAVVHLAESDTAQGPFNLCCEQVPTNEELTRALAHQVNRPAFFRVPVGGPADRRRRDGSRAAQLGQRLPGRAAGERFHLPRPGRQRRDPRGPGPLALTSDTRQAPPSRRKVTSRRAGRVLGSGRRLPAEATSPPATRSKTRRVIRRGVARSTRTAKTCVSSRRTTNPRAA